MIFEENTVTNIEIKTMLETCNLNNCIVFHANTNIQTYNKPDLMYVGMSRARNALCVFETKHAKSYREKL